MWEIAENLHRADLTVLEREEHRTEWIRLANVQSPQHGEIESKRADRRGHRHEGGIAAAGRELGISKRNGCGLAAKRPAPVSWEFTGLVLA